MSWQREHTHRGIIRDAPRRETTRPCAFPACLRQHRHLNLRVVAPTTPGTPRRVGSTRLGKRTAEFCNTIPARAGRRRARPACHHAFSTRQPRRERGTGRERGKQDKAQDESAKWQAVVCRLSCPSRVRPSRVFDRTLYAHTTYLCSTFDSKVRPVGLVPSLSLTHHDPSARRPISRSISQCSPPVLPSRPSLRGSRR